MATSNPIANTVGRTRTYGNWREPTAPGIGSMGLLTTLLGLVWLVFVIIIWSVGSTVAALIMLAVGGVAAGVVTHKNRDRLTIAQRVSSRVMFTRSRRKGHNLYRAGPLGQTPYGTCTLPGLAAASKLTEWRDSYDRPFALLHVPSTGHFTVVMSCDPDGAALVDQDQVDNWVANWGGYLADLGNEPGVTAAQVTVESAPDSGANLRREVTLAMDPDAPQLARDTLTEVLDTYPAGSAQVKALVTITFTAALRKGGKHRIVPEVARDVAARLPALTGSLAGTGAGAVRLVAAGELCEIVRTAYDPAAAALFDEAHTLDQPIELTWEDAGPMTADAHPDHYRHENATSITWVMAQAPRGEVYASILSRFLNPHPAIDRKRVTMLYRPHDGARAAQIVERDKNAADFAASGTKNRPASARKLLDQRSAAQAAEEEARGAGLVSFGLVCTATVIGADRLEDAAAAIDTLSASARLRLRRAIGSQDSAFAAALPLGLVMSDHLHIPAEIRETL